MHLSVRRFRAFAAAIALLATFNPATADDDTEASGNRIDWSYWTPSLTVGVGIMSSDVSSSIFGGFATDLNQSGEFNSVAELNSSTDIYGRANGDFCDSRFNKLNQGSGIRCVIDFPASKSFSLAGAVVPVGLEVKGPSMPGLPGNARLFFQGGYGFPRDSKKELAVSIAPAVNDPNKPNVVFPLFDNSELQVTTTGESQGLWWAGAGLSFTVPMGEYDVNLKPSINYYGDQLSHTVAVKESLTTYPLFDINPITGGSLKRFRTVSRSTDTFHAIAPGFGMDIELGRRGPVAVGVYVNALVALFLSERSVSFSRVSVPVPGRPTTGTGTGLNETDPRAFDNLGNPRIAGSPNSSAVNGVPGRGEVRQVYDRYSIVASGGIMFTWVGEKD